MNIPTSNDRKHNFKIEDSLQSLTQVVAELLELADDDDDVVVALTEKAQYRTPGLDFHNRMADYIRE